MQICQGTMPSHGSMDTQRSGPASGAGLGVDVGGREVEVALEIEAGVFVGVARGHPPVAISAPPTAISTTSKPIAPQAQRGTLFANGTLVDGTLGSASVAGVSMTRSSTGSVLTGGTSTSGAWACDVSAGGISAGITVSKVGTGFSSPSGGQSSTVVSSRARSRASAISCAVR